jgi:hypothetical protein
LTSLIEKEHPCEFDRPSRLPALRCFPGATTHYAGL